MKSDAPEFKPQPGFQYDFLSTPADIAIGGGAAGSGKTFALLLEALRYAPLADFGGTIFRKTYTQIDATGGLWDTSMKVYPFLTGTPIESKHEWVFSPGSRIKFSHLEYEKNVLDWQGSQIPFIGFDELPHFSEHSFTYLLSRNRCILPDLEIPQNGKPPKLIRPKPYVRATCNPDPDSWVANLISWWIEQDHNSPKYGYPILERTGKLRYYIKDAGEYVWGNSKKEVLDQVQHVVKMLQEADPDINPDDLVKSITFIPGTIYGNRELLRADPGYLGNLLAQNEAGQAQLLHGNWKVHIDGSDLINVHKLKETFNNSTVPGGNKYITADIALKGSDLLVVMVWDGFRMIDCEGMPKSKGPEIIELIKRMASTYSVPNGNITYDNDGIGGFIDGYISNAYPFNNGRRAVMRENYKNLKTQMYFKLGDRINRMGYYIDPKVARKMIGTKTIEQHLMEERRAIKRDKVDEDGKLCIIPKSKMIEEIIGHSPDFMDAWMMREIFEYLEPATQMTAAGKSSMGFY